jgi:hypothetical protein
MIAQQLAFGNHQSDRGRMRLLRQVFSYAENCAGWEQAWNGGHLNGKD